MAPTPGELALNKELAALRNWPAQAKAEREARARMVEATRNQWAINDQANRVDPCFPSQGVAC